MRKLYIVKLGGSLITDKDKPFTERRQVIYRLGQELLSVKKITNVAYVVGHGGGSFPHVPATKYRTVEGIINKQSLNGIVEVQNAAAKLNRIVVEIFIKLGLKPISINPSSCLLADNDELKYAFWDTLLKSTFLGLIPVIYGDVILDLQKGCTIYSGERILNLASDELGKYYKIRKMIHCGITDGVYDDNFQTISMISDKNFTSFEKNIKRSASIDVTGGMLHKVKESLLLAKKGIVSVIINGNRAGELENVLLNKPHHGTEISFVQ